jgi:hypothetical protein
VDIDFVALGCSDGAVAFFRCVDIGGWEGGAVRGLVGRDDDVLWLGGLLVNRVIEKLTSMVTLTLSLQETARMNKKRTSTL